MSGITPLRSGTPTLPGTNQQLAPKVSKADQKVAKKAKRKAKLQNFVTSAKGVVNTVKDNIQSARAAGAQVPPMTTVNPSAPKLESNITTYVVYGIAALASGIIIYRTLKK